MRDMTGDRQRAHIRAERVPGIAVMASSKRHHHVMPCRTLDNMHSKVHRRARCGVATRCHEVLCYFNARALVGWLAIKATRTILFERFKIQIEIHTHNYAFAFWSCLCSRVCAYYAKCGHARTQQAAAEAAGPCTPVYE